MNKPPTVAWVPAWLDGCALFRMFMPSLHYPNSRFIFHPVRTPVSELGDADIVVVQRQCSQGNMQALKQMKEMGLKVIYDLDDDLWAIPGTSPAKAIFDPIKSGFGMCMEVCDLVTVSTEPLRTAVRKGSVETVTRSQTSMHMPKPDLIGSKIAFAGEVPGIAHKSSSRS